jgi:lysyl-tRNA synthetase class 2
VGGLPRVYEIARNFRNEGIDRSHNPEFTMMEVYEAYGDCWTMLELTESLVHVLAVMMAGDGAVTLPFGDLMIEYGKPFDRITYGDLFERGCGFAMTDEAKVREAATQVMSPDDAKKLDHWLIVDKLFGELGEAALDPTRPTFVTDYPSAISPLTRPNEDDPSLAHRWELFIAGMEFANAYTELNDPLVQRAKFEEQLAGADDEDSTFRTLDEDFLNALMVGMPPAGGLGVGLDRLFMVLTNQASIRDVILFPLLRPES